MATDIDVENVDEGVHDCSYHRTLKQIGMAKARGMRRQRHLPRRRRGVVHRQQGESDRADGPERFGQVHAAQADQRGHAARQRPRAHPRPDRRADRHRCGLPAAAERSGQPLPQRRHPGHERGQTRRKFDEIVDFADVGKFLDSPVGHYSSGMYARLGFAVAIHVDATCSSPTRCWRWATSRSSGSAGGRCRRSARTARTIFFVSHAPGAVRRLCDRVLVLEKGRLGFDGGVDEGIKYLHYDQGDGDEETRTTSSAPTAEPGPGSGADGPDVGPNRLTNLRSTSACRVEITSL